MLRFPNMRKLHCVKRSHWTLMLLPLVAALVGTVALAQPSPAGSTPAPGKLIWTGAWRQHIHCTGDGGPTVILAAGLGGTSLEWVRVQPLLADVVRVCSFDRAGYGWSDRRLTPRTALASVVELETLLRYASVPAPYILVGHSFGGLSARLFALRNPERVAGLVLIDSTHEDQFRRFDEAGIPTAVPRSAGFVISNLEVIPDNLPSSLRTLAQQLALSPPTVMTLYSELKHMRVSADQLRQQQRSHGVPMTIVAHNSLRRARTAQQKGRARIWLDLQKQLAEQTPGGELIIANHSGHHVHLDEPELVADAIRDVITRARFDDACEPVPTVC